MINRLSDNPHSKLLADFGHDLQSFFAQSLKCVGRSARLVSATTEELRSRSMHALSHRECLLAALDSAWPSHDREPGPADCGRRPRKPDHRVFFLHVAANELVGL